MTEDKFNRFKKLVDIAARSKMTDTQKRQVFNDIGTLAVKEHFPEPQLQELREYMGQVW